MEIWELYREADPEDRCGLWLRGAQSVANLFCSVSSAAEHLPSTVRTDKISSRRQITCAHFRNNHRGAVAVN